jgi:N-methylhydantoinase A/oxoprolinase/acetone carboxylase beta subunit
MGLLDPSTFFGGGLALDIDRARAAIAENIAEPLGASVDEALLQLRDAYEQKIANALSKFCDITEDTVLLAFGGAGPMNACGAANKCGIKTVYVPKTAAVFSAYGIGSCDIGQSYQVVLSDQKQETLSKAYEGLLERAERDMFAEGYAKGEYEITAQLVGEKDGSETVHVLNGNVAVPQGLAKADAVTLEVSARKTLRVERDSHAEVKKANAAKSSKTRSIFGDNKEWSDIPVYDVNVMEPGDFGVGPAVIEEEYFTCLVRDDWEFVVTELGDICLTKGAV